MKTIGLIFGGKSPEHDVSLSSARGILSNIDQEKYKVKEIYISAEGEFYSSKGILNSVVKGNHKLKAYDFLKNSKAIDIYFPILHGVGGEDGEIQGLIRSVNKPFVGSDILASALCLNKALFKLVLDSSGVSQLPFVIINSKSLDKGKIKEKIIESKKKLKFPVFVKAASLGSSVGVYKVNNANDLDGYIEKASKYDKEIVVEEGVVGGREIEVAVLGNNEKDIKVANPGEIVPGSDFYDYDDKYKNSQARTIVNTKLTKKIDDKIRTMARDAYLLMGCEGMARVDFFITKNGKVYLNEINTIPGFTPISMYPQMWQASGLSYRNLISKLIDLGLKNK